jgi:hypothetical protein
VDSEKHRKMMLVTAAVLSVGAGSYWFLGRDSGAGRPDALVEGNVVRKPRATADTPAPPRKPPHTVPANKEEATVPTRKTREGTEDTNPGRKPRSRPDKTVTIKPITPMG